MAYNRNNNYNTKPLNNFKKSYYNFQSNNEVSIYDETFPNKFNLPYQKHYKQFYKQKHYKNYPKQYHNNDYSKSKVQNTYLSSSSSTQSSSPPPSFSSTQLTSNSNLNNKTIQQPMPSSISQVLLNTYEGICNFIIFAKESSLYVSKDNVKELKEITLKSFFNNFDYFISCGSEISFLTPQTQIAIVNYSLTLSSMLLYVNLPSNELFQNILNKIKSKHFKEKTHMCYYIDDSLQVYFDLNQRLLKIEYYESKPPHQRGLITEVIDYLLNILELTDLLVMKYIDSKSWFCFSWIPIHSTQSEFNNSSFLVYYQFASDEKDLYNRGYNGYYEIPIIGILPIKFNEELWLRKIKKVNLGSLYYHREYIDFKMALDDSISNVHEFIFRDTNRTSLDYDFYVRNNSQQKN